MTEQTSETTLDALDVAAVKRVERYLDGRSGDDLIDWNGGGAGPELLASDLTLLLAALDEARGERDIARHAAEAWQVAHDEAETRAEAAEARAAAADRALERVRALADANTTDGEFGGLVIVDADELRAALATADADATEGEA